MFTKKIDDNLTLKLVEPRFAKTYLNIVQNQRKYLVKWLGWAEHAKDEAFFFKVY